jgi:hypothetical protein
LHVDLVGHLDRITEIGTGCGARLRGDTRFGSD